MEFGNLINGFHVALQPTTIFSCFIGVLIGTLVGVLPGLGPVAAISLLLPVTMAATPVNAIIMLAGIYYGHRTAKAWIVPKTALGCIPLNSVARKILVMEPSITMAAKSSSLSHSHARTKASLE